MSIQITPLSIEDILKDESPSLYVVNNTDRQRSRPKGILHMIVRDNTGEEITFNIPNTWIPIDLANYCDVKSIRASNSFRSYIRSGILLSITSSEAKSILNNADAQKEADAVRVKENEIAQATPLKTDNNNKVTIFGGSSQEEDTTSPVQTNEPVIASEIKMLVEDFNRGDDDIATSRRVQYILGDKDSWIWASTQIHQTSSSTYQAIADKIGEF